MSDSPLPQPHVVVSEANMWRELNALPFADSARLEFVAVTDTAAMSRALGTASAYVGTDFRAEWSSSVGDALALIQIAAAGTEHLDLDGFPAGPVVCNSYGHERSVAEHVLMVTLASLRELRNTENALRENRWLTRMHTDTAASFPTLDRLRVGIVGMGRIGRSVAAMFDALGAHTSAVTRTPTAHRDGVPAATDVRGLDALGALFDDSDVVVLCAALASGTEGLIDRALLDRLGPSGILVNVARGGLVREADLHDALRERTLGHAAIDVWSAGIGVDDGAPSPHPFHELNNIVMTPHYSATAITTYQVRAAEIARNIASVLAGGHATDIVRTGTRRS